MKSKFLCIILIIALLFSLSGNALASFNDIAGNPHSNEIEQMAELGILNGYGDGRFGPTDLLTRAQAAKVAGYLLGFTDQDAEEAKSWPSMFGDVYVGMGKNEWAIGWINLVASEGIIQGYDGNYHHGDNLQMSQWAAILIRILGYEEDNMSWPGDYNSKAEQLGLTNGLNYMSKNNVNRGEMSRFSSTAIYNIQKADGTKIIDILQSQGQSDEEQNEQPTTSVATVSIKTTPEFISEGGGKAVKIDMTVTDDEGQPAEGVSIYLNADGFESSGRNQQLSKTEVVTDSNGKAEAVYTTLTQDDNKLITINLTVMGGNIELFKNIYLTAANQATKIEGTVSNPFTGDSQYASIFIENIDFNNKPSLGGVNTDDKGNLSLIVPNDKYGFWLELDLSDNNLNINKEYTSSHFSLTNNSIRHKLIVDTTNTSGTYTLDYNPGILKGVVPSSKAGKELYIYRITNAKDGMLIKTASDGSFIAPILPGTYDIIYMGNPDPFTRVTIKSFETKDLGYIK